MIFSTTIIFSFLSLVLRNHQKRKWICKRMNFPGSLFLHPLMCKSRKPHLWWQISHLSPNIIIVQHSLSYHCYAIWSIIFWCDMYWFQIMIIYDLNHFSHKLAEILNLATKISTKRIRIIEGCIWIWEFGEVYPNSTLKFYNFF